MMSAFDRTSASEHLEHYRDKTVLVTGGTGFIGSALVDALSTGAARLLVHTGSRPLPPSESSAVEAEISRRDGDLGSAHFWDAAVEEVDCVFHLAAQTSSRYANEHPVEDLTVNLLPVTRFVDACFRRQRRPDFIFAGTVTQVGLTHAYPLDESVADDPITVYDINKLAAELYLRYYGRDQGGRSVTLRLPNVYGPGPRSRHGDRGILNMMVRRALRGEALTIYGDGDYVRDFLHVGDAARAFLAAGARAERTGGRRYVVGSGAGHTVADMARTVSKVVAEATGVEVEVTHVPLPDDLPRIDRRSFVADATRFRNDTGWAPAYDLAAGVRDTARAFAEDA